MSLYQFGVLRRVPEPLPPGVDADAVDASGHRKVCSWCTLNAAALVASVPAAYPEARDAVRHIRR